MSTAPNVTIIPAKIQTAENRDKYHQLKVAAYCRVSTEQEEQQNSYQVQIAYYTDLINRKKEWTLAGIFADEGISGTQTKKRTEFNRMMEDIKCGKDNVSFVLVFKLSRFGRNAADVLSTLQTMQDFGVNLICVEDGIDSSKDAGKLVISVLSAVAEIERENIRVQTMEGRLQKAREGKWNGGFAPYGYDLVNGALIVNKEEAEAVKLIFDLYVHKKMGGRLIAQYLERHGIQKLSHQNTKGELFSAAYVREILKNPAYLWSSQNRKGSRHPKRISDRLESRLSPVRRYPRGTCFRSGLGRCASSTSFSR